MLKRMLFMLAVVAVLLGSLGFVKFHQIQTAIAQGASFQPPPTAVTTIVVDKETWPATLDVIGTVAAIQGVTVSADLPGTVAKIHFESGQWVHEGDILVELDTRQERAQLAAQQAQWELARINYGRTEKPSDCFAAIAESDLCEFWSASADDCPAWYRAHPAHYLE